jgi:hypothetical protein
MSAMENQLRGQRNGEQMQTVLVEPPIAMSSAMAFMKAWRVAMDRGQIDVSSRSYLSAPFPMRLAAF